MLDEQVNNTIEFTSMVAPEAYKCFNFVVNLL